MPPTKRIICKHDGPDGRCTRRRLVAVTSGAKYCRWHSIKRARFFGLGYPRKCKFKTGSKAKQCGAEFVPLHQGDRLCEKHALPLNVEHREGTCAVCGEKRRLYLNADWCTRCLRKTIEAGGVERLLTHQEVAAERQAAEQRRIEREAKQRERDARYEAERPQREAEQRERDARYEAQQRERRAKAEAEHEARLEQLRQAAKASPYTDPEMLVADLEGQGFTVDEMQSIKDDLEQLLRDRAHAAEVVV